MKDELKYYGMHAGASADIFRKAEMLRNNMTEHEKIVWEFLKSRPVGYKFRRQHPFGIYILDFYCHKRRLSIEVDGRSHKNPLQTHYDQERTRFINRFGIEEIRFSNIEISNNLSKVIQMIIDKLREGTL